jgi:protein subunit release factor B
VVEIQHSVTGIVVRRKRLSKNHRTAAANVTAKLSIHLEDVVSTKTVRRELHKSNIHGRTVIAKYLFTENKAKRRKS